MSQRISEITKKRLSILQSEYGVKIEKGIVGYKIIGLNNGTEPRAVSFDAAIVLAEKECSRIYAKYIQEPTK